MSKSSARRLEELFASPAGEYMPVPWWAWTGKLDPKLLKKQLRLMHDQGIREFFIFPIYGMEVEYMSDAYLDRIGMVLEWCGALGMKVWIYDEYNWPSRTAGGRVARRHPEAIAANLHLENHTGVSAVKIGQLLADPSVIHVAQVRPDGTAQAVTRDVLSDAEGADVAVYRRVRDKTVGLTVKGSLWCRNEPGMLDMLSKAACKAYIEEAYEPIAGRFSRYLGSTVKGFFTDEPSIAPGTVPWTDGFPERFREKHGYDIVPQLHDLTFDTPTSERTRVDYWSLVTEMYADAFTGQIADWCEAHGLLLTGHMVYEENSYSVWYQGDSPAQLRRMLFVANMTPGNKEIEIGWPGGGEVELWDAAAGNRWKPDQSPGKCRLALPEDEAIWVVQSAGVSDAGSEVPAHFLSAADSEPSPELGGTWEFTPDRPNLHKPAVKLRPDADGSLQIGSPELQSDDAWTDVNEGDAGRDLVEVSVDGISLGKRAWGPRAFMARDLRPGEHTVEVRITNTLGGNLRRGYWGAEVLPVPPSGLMSPPRIVALDGRQTRA